MPSWLFLMAKPPLTTLKNVDSSMVFNVVSMLQQIWWLRKKSNFCVALHSSSLRRTINTSHSSEFARLEFGAFYFAIKI